MRRSKLAVYFAVLALSACSESAPPFFQGYVEGEYVYVASPHGGELVRLGVAKGDTVAAGAVLFELDPNPQALQIEETTQRLEQARSKLADLEKGLRPSELAAIEARLARARTGLGGAERELERRRELAEASASEAVSAEELDRFRTDRDMRRSEVASFEAELETARLGGRDDALAAARNEVGALEAAREELRWQLDQKSATAAAAGLVQDTLYRVGEYVQAGRAVIALLPPENVKIRFFVPQAKLSALHIGDAVEVHVDGLDQRIPARIRFLANEAEFTPPVIYSKESRTKLVFLIEAVPEASFVDRLRPGQPLEVHVN